MVKYLDLDLDSDARSRLEVIHLSGRAFVFGYFCALSYVQIMWRILHNAENVVIILELASLLLSVFLAGYKSERERATIIGRKAE